MYFRLIDFIDKHNILHTKQCRFQKGKSAERVSLDLYCNIFKATENQEKKIVSFKTWWKPLML